MKKKHKKSKNRFLKILFVLALLVVAAVVASQFIDFKNLFTPKEEEISQVDPTPTPTPTPTPEPTPEPEPEPEPEPTPTTEPPKPETQQYDGGNPNDNELITGVITFASASGDNLMIRVNIDQYLNGGNCNLVLNKGGTAAYGASARIIDVASTSTCEGFNVPLSELPSGKYEIVINLTSERKTGTIRGEVNI